MFLTEIAWEVVDWFNVALNSVNWRAVGNNFFRF